METVERFVFTIITAKTCGKCLLIKGKNNIFQEEEEADRYPILEDLSYDLPFIKNVLHGGAVRVQEVVFRDLSASPGTVEELTIYTLKNDNVEVISYKKQDESMTKTINYGTSQKLSIKFNKFIEKFVPYRLYNFTLMFPGFVVATVEEWNKGCGSTKEFFNAYSIGCVHVKHGKNWIVDKSDKSSHLTNLIDPRPKLDEIIKGRMSLDIIPADEEIENALTRRSVLPYIGPSSSSWLKHRGNDGERLFSNGMPYSFIPDDFYIFI